MAETPAVQRIAGKLSPRRWCGVVRVEWASHGGANLWWRQGAPPQGGVNLDRNGHKVCVVEASGECRPPQEGANLTVEERGGTLGGILSRYSAVGQVEERCEEAIRWSKVAEEYEGTMRWSKVEEQCRRSKVARQCEGTLGRHIAAEECCVSAGGGELTEIIAAISRKIAFPEF